MKKGNVELKGWGVFRGNWQEITMRRSIKARRWITASDNRELKQFISEISTSHYNWLEIEWCEKYFSSLKTTYLYNVQLLIKIKYLFRLQYHLETFWNARATKKPIVIPF